MSKFTEIDTKLFYTYIRLYPGFADRIKEALAVPLDENLSKDEYITARTALILERCDP